MPLLALCLQLRRHTGTDGSFSRPRVMAQTAWFSRVIAEQKLESQMSLGKRRDANEAADQCPVEVIVNVSKGTVYEGPLTAWTNEEEVLWETLGRPYGAMSLCVQHSIILQRPCVMQRPSQVKIPIFSPAVPASGVRLKGFDTAARHELLDEAGLLRALQVSADELRAFFNQPVCFVVHPVILELIRRSAWSTLMLCAKWREPLAERLLPGWRDAMRAADLVKKHVPVPSVGLSQTDAGVLATNLKMWSQNILATTSSEDDAASLKLALEEAVLKLETFRGSRLVSSSDTAYQHETIVAALCSSMKLRRRSDLAPLLRDAIASMFPHLDLDGDNRIPSGPTLSRKQLLVDAAYSCYWRDLLQQHRGPMYVWADASPQGGFDWFLSILSLVKQEDLQEVVQAADYLADSVARFACACETDDKDELAEIANKRHACGKFLKRAVKLHRQVPIALGSGFSSLDQKVKALCQKFWNESQGLQDLRRLLSRVRGVCTDMGTEMSLPEVEGIDLKDFLPRYMLDEELFSEEMPFEGPSDTYFLPAALLSPGVLHITDNMTKEVDASLPFWRDWLGGFKAVTHLISAGHVRQRFVALCIKGTRFEWLQKVFDKGMRKPADWRWGTICAVLPHVLSLKYPLQAVWNPALFAKKGDARSEEEQESLNLDILTSAIESNKWWLQSELVLQLNSLGKDPSAWAEGCDCHAWLRPTNAAEEYERKRFVHSHEAQQLQAAMSSQGLSRDGDGDGFVCPLAGRRSAHLACGAVQEYYEDAAGKRLHELRLTGLSYGVDASDIFDVCSHFAAGRAAMQAYLFRKLQCWEVLPWKLCGISHSNPAKARACAVACLEMFKESPQDEKLHHRVTWAALCEGSAIRADIEQFIAGTNLCELTSLKEFAWELKLIPTVERVQEGDHSIVNRMVVYRRVTGSYVSCSLRVPEIQSLMQTDAEYKLFLSKFDEVANIDDLAKKFGFWKHPQWQAACHAKQSKKQKSILAGIIMYYTDLESQFQNMSHARRGREKRARERKKQEQDWKAHFERPKKFSLETVVQVAMGDHLQSELQVGRLYSLPEGAVAVRSLRSSVQPLHKQPAPADHASGTRSLQDRQRQLLELNPDVESFPHAATVDSDRPPAAADSLESEQTVYLRLTCARPSRNKLVRLPVASARRLGSDEFCVSLHKSFTRDGLTYVDIEPASTEGVGPPAAVVSIFSSDVSALQEGRQCWSTVKSLSFGLAGCEEVMSFAMMRILGEMVSASAFPPSGESDSEAKHYVVDTNDLEAVQCLQMLSRLGCVQKDGEMDGKHLYSFTRSGVQKLRHMHKATAPEMFFKSPAALADIPREELCYCTTWELIMLLQHAGWRLRQAPSARILKKSPLPPHTPEALESGHLQWYLRSVSVQGQKSYLLALLKSPELFQQSGVVQIHHCQKVSYYDKVLHGSFDGQVAFASVEDSKAALPVLSLDVEADADDARALPARTKTNTSASQKCVAAAQQSEGDVEQLMDLFDDEEEPAEAHTSDSGERSLLLESASGDLDYEPSVQESEASLDRGEAGGEGALDATPAARDSPRNLLDGDAAMVSVEAPTLSGSGAAAAPVQEQRPLARRGERQVNPDTFEFGHFRLTFVGPEKRPPHGMFQARCLYHKKNDVTGCKRSIACGGAPDAKDVCRRILMSWCLEAPLHQTQRSHLGVLLSSANALPMEVLESRLADLPPPPSNVRTDEEIDADATIAHRSEPKAASTKRRASKRARPEPSAKADAQAKPKPKAKAKSAKSKPKAKAKAKARAVSPGDEAGSDPESDSSDSDSSSSSSSSTSSDSSSRSSPGSASAAASGSDCISTDSDKKH